MYTIKVRMRKLGKKNQGAVEPVEFLLESRPETVKELVEGLVCLGVRQYNERKDTGQIVPWLTSETIQEQAVRERSPSASEEGTMRMRTRRWRMRSSVLKTGSTGSLPMTRN